MSSFHLLQLISAPQLAPKKAESILIFHSDECEMKTLNEKLDQIARAAREGRGGEGRAAWLAGHSCCPNCSRGQSIVCAELGWDALTNNN